MLEIGVVLLAGPYIDWSATKANARITTRATPAMMAIVADCFNASYAAGR